ncbi:MAG: cytochrome c [Sinobacteraceae bacterium]|nr:cytochrome c [Nevskiaceae bacterium]
MHQMYDQPKYKPLTPSELFADGNSSRPEVAGTVPRTAGALAGSSSGRLGEVPAELPPGPAVAVNAKGATLARGNHAVIPVYSNPLPITQALLARGQERFNINCAPCHSIVGDGDGMIVRRGFPSPPSYHTDRLRSAPDSHFYQVISNGYGAMYPYADRIAPADRWAIVAYIRALQLSQHLPASELSAEDRAKLPARLPGDSP